MSVIGAKSRLCKADHMLECKSRLLKITAQSSRGNGGVGSLALGTKRGGRNFSSTCSGSVGLCLGAAASLALRKKISEINIEHTDLMC